MSDAVLSQFKQAEKENKINADRKLKIGIIGCGNIAGAHMGEYNKMPDVEVIAGADIIPGKAEHFFHDIQEKPYVRCYNSGIEMLENEPELDAVSICTYNSQHAVNAIAALKKDIPVLLEKPFTVTVDEAVAVIKAEKESKAFVSVGFQPRLDRNMQMIGKICKSGVLGEIYYIQTGGGRRRGFPGGTFIEKSTAGLGALGDIGCYSLDMVLNAIGYPKPITITGYLSDFFGKDPKYNGDDAERFSVDDFSAAFIRLEGGIILDYRIAWAMHPDTPGDTIIFGKEGALRIPSTESWNGSIEKEMTLYHDICGEQVETKIPLIYDENYPFYYKVRSFLDAVKSESKTAPVPTKEILINQVILEGIKKSADLGHEIEVTVPKV